MRQVVPLDRCLCPPGVLCRRLAALHRESGDPALDVKKVDARHENFHGDTLGGQPEERVEVDLTVVR